jgi:predicted DNA-binding protein
MSTPKFIIDAAMREASRTRTAEEQLASELVSVTRRHIARIEAIENAEDARAGDLEWERVKTGKSNVRSAQEVKSALGL